MSRIGLEILNLAKRYGAVFTDDRHFADDCDKLVEQRFTPNNSENSPLCTECGHKMAYQEPWYCPSPKCKF